MLGFKLNLVSKMGTGVREAILKDMGKMTGTKPQQTQISKLVYIS